MDRVYRQLRREVMYDRDVTTSIGDALKHRFGLFLLLLIFILYFFHYHY